MDPSQFKLSSPWESHARKLAALFDGDEEISVKPDFDGDKKTIRIYCDNAAKADALAQLLPMEVQLGNVAVEIVVMPPNGKQSPAALVRTAFAGNPHFAGVTVVNGMYGNPVTYAQFHPHVAQFWNDDMSNPHGVTSRLYQTLAADCLTSEAASGAIFTTKASEES